MACPQLEARLPRLTNLHDGPPAAVAHPENVADAHVRFRQTPSGEVFPKGGFGQPPLQPLLPVRVVLQRIYAHRLLDPAVDPLVSLLIAREVRPGKPDGL